MWTLAGKSCKRKAAQGDLSLLKLKEARQLPGWERGADLTHREAQEIVKRLWKHTEMGWGGGVVFQYLPLSLLSREYTKAQVLVIKNACLHFLGWTFFLKRRKTELFAQVHLKWLWWEGKSENICFDSLFSLITFQEKTCYLWKDVLVSMPKVHIRTWPTLALCSLGTSFIHLWIY